MLYHQYNLIILTCSGLANRLKPILSGIRLAHISHRNLYIHWNTAQTISPLEDKEPQAPKYESESRTIPFDGDWCDFFRYDIQRSHHEMCTGPGVKTCVETIPREGTGTYLCRYAFRFIRFDDEPVMDFLEHDKLSLAQHILKADILRFLPRLEPTPRLCQTISSFANANGINRSTVGIHLRRNHPSTTKIPLRTYISALDKALEQKRNVLLATDSPEVEALFKARYRDRLVFHSKGDRFRGNRTAIEDAIIDLFLLAKVGHLIGSWGSSFSDLAWWLGGCRASNEYVK